NAGNQPSFVFTTNVYERFGFDMNSTHVFVGDSLTSTNVIKFQLEDALYIHSDIVFDTGASNILQEVYTSGTGDFSTVQYKCSQYQVFAKPLAHSISNVFHFSLTDEFGTLMNLNGLNWNATLFVFDAGTPGTPKTVAEAKG